MSALNVQNKTPTTCSLDPSTKWLTELRRSKNCGSFQVIYILFKYIYKPNNISVLLCDNCQSKTGQWIKKTQTKQTPSRSYNASYQPASSCSTLTFTLWYFKTNTFIYTHYEESQAFRADPLGSPFWIIGALYNQLLKILIFYLSSTQSSSWSLSREDISNKK